MEHTFKYDLYELDGCEFSEGDDARAVIDFDFDSEPESGPYNPNSTAPGRDRFTGFILNTVTFQGENILPRLTEDQVERAHNVLYGALMNGQLDHTIPSSLRAR
jgi:hypothetical protein